jgi:glutamate synthase domain-containing protein 3
MRINAKGLHYKELNELIHQAVDRGRTDITLDNVNGQRYIGDGLSGNITLTVEGVPGNDLAAFMDGPTIVVNSNTQEGAGNTMSAGKIIVNGDVGDITGHSMRGGRVYIKGNAGYRTGIHMKSYKDLYPVIIIGGRACDFLGEYMAGGLIVVLGLNQEANGAIVGNYCGTGMHGGAMYIRGNIEDYQLGKEVKKFSLNKQDDEILRKYLREYCSCFSLSLKEVAGGSFLKLIPSSHRPYGKLYAY